MEKKIVVLFILFASAVILTITTGCASILSESKYPVQIECDPKGATAFVIDRGGNIVKETKTPAIVFLKSGWTAKDEASHFHAVYAIIFVKNGYRECKANLIAQTDSIVFLNLISPSFVLGFEYDKKTGAAWEITNDVKVYLTPDDKSQKLSDNEYLAKYRKKLKAHLEVFRATHNLE